MKNQIIKLTSIAIACIAIASCDTDFDNPVNSGSNSGTADLSKFVTIGDSLTAGYADNSLYLAGQENSYPAILAQQFAKVGGDNAFTQPLVNDNLGGLLFGGGTNPDFWTRLILDVSTVPPTPEPIAGTPTTEVFSLQTGSFSNMGVPGAKSFHLGAPGYGDAAGLAGGTANPYFVRFASSTTTTMIEDAAAQAPSFIVMWAGNNDVLSYATSGGIGVDRLGNIDPTTYDSNDITDPAVFFGTYNGLVGAFKAANTNVQGVLVNIPDVSTIPYFTTVPHNPVPLDQPTADFIMGSLGSGGYTDYNAGLVLAETFAVITPAELAKRTISFTGSLNNAVVIEDEYLTPVLGLPSIRQATSADLLVLTSATKIGTLANPANPASVWGVGVPLVDGDVLIPEEIALVDAARTAFNTTIAGIAAGDANLVLVDSAAIMLEISTTGIDYGLGGVVNAEYGAGGAFSLDGVHPTARGYAVMANAIIDAINTGFSASIPKVYPGDYTTIFIK